MSTFQCLENMSLTDFIDALERQKQGLNSLLKIAPIVGSMPSMGYLRSNVPEKFNVLSEEMTVDNTIAYTSEE